MALTDLTRISTSGIATGSTIDAPILRKDVSFRGTQIGVTSALFDSSDNALEFNDNVKLKFGNSGDLNIFHNGTNSIIQDSGQGNLELWGENVAIRSANGGEVLAGFTYNGSVDLFYNNYKKFETTQTGAIVTGILTATGFSGPLSNPSGISTFYDLRVTNNLTVEGTTSTLDTTLIGVDRVEVGANSNSIVGVAVTQSGTADLVNLFDGATKVVTVDDVGNVGLGTDNPDRMLHIKGTGNAIVKMEANYSGSVTGIEGVLTASGANRYVTGVYGKVVNTSGSESNVASIRLWNEQASPTTSDSPGYITFNTTNDGASTATEKLRIDSSGRLIIGGGSSRAVGFEHRLQLEDTNDTPHSFSMISNRPNAFGVHLSFAKSRGSTRGSNTIVQDDDEIATLVFRGADGTDLGTIGAMIDVRVDGTPASNKVPASFEFHTMNTGGTLGERLRIDSSGNVLVGTTDTSLYNNGDSASEGIVLRNGEAIDIARKGDLQMTLNRQTNDGPHIAFYRSGGVKSFISTRNNAFCIDVNSTNERLRIQSDGKLIVSTNANTTTAFDYAGIYFDSDNSTAAEGLFVNNIAANTGDNASISFSTDSGNRKKSAISHVDTGSYGRGDLVFSIDPDADSGELDIVAHEKLRILSDGQVSVNYDAHHTSSSGILNAIATTSGKFGYKAIEIGAAIADGTAQGALIVGRRKAASSIPTALLGCWDDGTNVTLYHGGGWSTWSGSATKHNFYTDDYATGDNSGGTRLSIGSKGQIYLNNRDSNNSSHRGQIIAYAPPTGEFAYKSLEIGSTNPTGQANGGLIVAQRMGTTAYPFALMGSWDNGSVCNIYYGGGWGSQSANATHHKFYVGSYASSGGAGGSEVFNISSTGVQIDQGTAGGNYLKIKNDEISLLQGVYGTGDSYAREAFIGCTRVDSGTYPILRLAGQNGIKLCVDANNERFVMASKGGIKLTCGETYYAANLAECNSNNLAFNINQTRSGQTKGMAFGAIGNGTTRTGIQCYDTSNNNANTLLLNPHGGKVAINITGEPSAQFEIANDSTTGQLHVKHGWASRRFFSLPIINNETRWYKIVNYAAGNMLVGSLQIYTTRQGGFNQTKGYNEWKVSYVGYSNSIYGTGAENSSFYAGTGASVDIVTGGSPVNVYIKVPGSIYAGYVYFIFEGIMNNWQLDGDTYLTSAP